MRPSKSLLGTLFITSAVGLALGGCNRNTANQPLSSADLALPQTAAATSPGPLNDRYGPPPKKIPVGRVVNPRDDWAWADRSYALDSVFYDTPPDYGFYYDDYEPWVWQTSDRWAMYGDPYDYGYPYDDDYYYYYYQPGAVRPYFIRDAEYGYGFDDVGRLVIVYDLLGRIMPQSFVYQREPYASRYYQRAYAVRQASLRAEPVAIAPDVWQQRAPIVQRTQQRWMRAAQTQPQWVDYRQRADSRLMQTFADDRRARTQRTFAAAGAARQPANRGFFANPLGGRTQTAPAQGAPAQLAQNAQPRRGFFGLGGRNRDQAAQAGQAAPAGGLFGGARDRQRPDRTLQVQQQAQAGQNRRGFLNGGDRQVQRQQQAQANALADQARGRDRQALARQQQVQQRDLAAQARQENGRQRQEMARQQQAQQRELTAQARQENGRQRQEVARQQQAQQRAAEAAARQDQSRQRQEMMRQQQAQSRQAEVQARQQQQAQAREAQAQARQQQQAQVRDQARQQQAQARQAEAQARQQQMAQARQAQAQARQQQQAQQRQVQEQARQQQTQQAQAQRQQQARPQPPQAQPQQANTDQQQGNGRGHGKKG